MRVVLIHNRYREPGGEDCVFSAEAALLQREGNLAGTVEASNWDTGDGIGAAFRSIWSRGSYERIRAVLKDTRPDILHVHNTLAVLSPSVYYAAADEGVAVVQTLHNYRLVCPGANLSREGRPCTECIDRRLHLPGIRHKCYRGSRLATATVAATTALHRGRGTWSNKVHAYIALSQFSKKQFSDSGVPPERVIVRSNFIDHDWGVGGGVREGLVYVGRLSHEKGVDLLLDAWKQLSAPPPLMIVGDGPLRDLVAEACRHFPLIRAMGHLADKSEVMKMIQHAKFLVLPSRVYENCPVSLLEAFCAGTPVIVSGHGAPAEVVTPPVNGFHFRAGDAADLANVLEDAFAAGASWSTISQAARDEFETKYDSAVAYDSLMSIYRVALENRDSCELKRRNPLFRERFR